MRSLILIMAGLALAGTAEAATRRAARAPAPPPAPPPAAALPPAVLYDTAPWWMQSRVLPQTGEAQIELPANRASFSVTFRGVDDKVETAQAKAARNAQALSTALTRLGADKVRLNTAFEMTAIYRTYRDKEGNMIEDRRGDRIKGYEVTMTLTVDVRDVSLLEQAYALAQAARPDIAGEVSFSLDMTNEQNAALWAASMSDAHARAEGAAAAAGAALGDVLLIDPTGRACRSNILARAPEGSGEAEDYESYDGYAPEPMLQVRASAKRDSEGTDVTADSLEASALANAFRQTPPLMTVTAPACVVYRLN